MRRILFACTLATAFASASLFAQTSAKPVSATTPAAPPVAHNDTNNVANHAATVLPASTSDLETIVVSGRQPGPGLWKVRKGDHTLWILGTQSPLPKRMEWDSAYVERRVAESQEVLESPSVSVTSDLGLFRSLMLVPSALKARKNPDDKTLQQVVPPAQYARWLVLKQRYIGSDRGIESWRPVFAALQLYDKAIERTGLTQDSLVADVVRKAAKKHDVTITTPKLSIKIKDPKAALKEFSNESLEDQACFGNTLNRIEGDLGAMVGRANAWAQGDIESLRSLPYYNQFTTCTAALTGTAIARKQGINDIQQQVENAWMSAAEVALAKNASTFAVLPISQLIQPTGYLQKLAAKGYMIEEP